MPANANDPSCVYYINDASCTDPYRHGYIGITSNELSRRSDHRRSGRFPADFVWTILFRGTRQECAAVEKNTDRNAASAGTPISAVAVGATQKSQNDESHDQGPAGTADARKNDGCCRRSTGTARRLSQRRDGSERRLI